MMQRASHVEQSSLSWLDLPDHNNIIIIIIVIVFLGTGTINVMCVAMTDFDIHQPVYRIKKKKGGVVGSDKLLIKIFHLPRAHINWSNSSLWWFWQQKRGSELNQLPPRYLCFKQTLVSECKLEKADLKNWGKSRADGTVEKRKRKTALCHNMSPSCISPDQRALKSSIIFSPHI